MSINKRVLYISYDGMTDPLGQSQVIPYLEKLSQQGYQITILSVEKKEKWKKSGKMIKELLDASGINWVTLFFSSRPPLLSKVYDQWNLNRKAASLQRGKAFDLIHCRSYVAAEAALKISRKHDVPFLFDMRGFWVDERVDSGQWDMKKAVYKKLYNRYKKKEKAYFLSAAHIVSLTEKGKEELIRNYSVPEEKVTVIPCCADLRLFDFHTIDEAKRRDFKNKLEIPEGSIVLSYLGSLGGWYMTDEMLDFFAAFRKKNPKAIFLVISHNDKNEVLSKAEKRGIPQSAIRVYPAARSEVPLYLSVSNWSINFIRDVYSKIASSPTKQGEIMGMGIPLICNDIGDTGRIISESAAGLLLKVFSENEYSDLAERMNTAQVYDPEKIREGAKKHYDLAKGARKYLDIYQRLIA